VGWGRAYRHKAALSELGQSGSIRIGDLAESRFAGCPNFRANWTFHTPFSFGVYCVRPGSRTSSAAIYAIRSSNPAQSQWNEILTPLAICSGPSERPGHSDETATFEGPELKPNKHMKDLKKYFAGLSRYERVPGRQMVAEWVRSDIRSVTHAFQLATKRSRIFFHVDPEISAPSLGNRVANEFVNGVAEILPHYSLAECPGNGYPDRILKRLRDGRRFAFELKAKTGFDPADGHRVVLTSTGKKLRRHFSPDTPICHLLATVFYSRCQDGSRWRIAVEGLRLDFLSPATPVEVRWEASVSHRLLSRAPHPIRLLMPARARQQLAVPELN